MSLTLGFWARNTAMPLLGGHPVAFAPRRLGLSSGVDLVDWVSEMDTIVVATPAGGEHFERFAFWVAISPLPENT